MTQKRRHQGRQWQRQHRLARLLAQISTESSEADDVGITKHTNKLAPIRFDQPSLEAPTSEAELRVQLAACYRMAEMLGWTDTINNHFTVQIPGTDHFLLNSYGMGYEEITASSLVKIDFEGNVIDPGSVRGVVNFAGFGIHGAIHKARPDAVCVMHTHETNVTAVSSMSVGLLPMTQTALACFPVSYHPYGEPMAPGECEYMCKNMGPTSNILMMDNHGVCTCGGTVAEAFLRMYYVITASEIQVKALGSNPSPEGAEAALKKIPKSTLMTPRFADPAMVNAGIKTEAPGVFALMMRRLDKLYPGYNDL